MDNIIQSTVPIWVSIFFLIVIFIPIVMIARVAKEGAINSSLNTKANTIFKTVLFFYIAWFGYTFLMSRTGLFIENTIPPKILLLTSIPLILFYLLVVSNLKAYKEILNGVTVQSLILLHSFRFIGGFFIIASLYGTLPAKFAYIAGIGDIITAIGSFFVANAITNKKSYATKLAYAWNIYGLLDIISVIITAIITTKLAIDTGSQSIAEIGRFPFCLIPAFAPATIIFLHITIFRKLKNFNNQN
jgi:hypothetical protein